MTQAPLTVTRQVHFRSAPRGRKVLAPGVEPQEVAPGRIPRVARLMALAIHFDELIRRGEVTDYAELARMAQVTRARVTQIMNLLHLAPGIQEALLNLPRCPRGRDLVSERALRPITGLYCWKAQHREWDRM